MGPYCHFCDQRCFVPIHTGWPEEVWKRYGTSTIAATCAAGQRFEKEKLGVCYADALAIGIGDPFQAVR